MIHIAFCTDENYMMPTGIAMTSICENNKSNDIVFHIVTSSSKSDAGIYSDLIDIGAKYNQRVELYYISKTRLEGLVCTGPTHISLATFIRLLLAEILPTDIEKVIYLDGDLVVLDSLSDFWNYPLLETDPLAAVEDSHSLSISHRSFTHTPLNIPYYNAGVLLINLSFWRKQDVGRKAVELAIKNKYPFMDQDVLNVMFMGNIKSLPMKYNVQTLLYLESEIYWMIDEQHADEQRTAVMCPSILHYSTKNKPWKEGLCPKREIWDEYKNKTVWHNLELQKWHADFRFSKYYDSLENSYYGNIDTFEEFAKHFLRYYNAAHRLKNEMKIIKVAAKFLDVMSLLLENVYSWKKRRLR